MGVDYTAVAGYGVHIPEELMEKHDLFDGYISEFLDGFLLKDTGLEWSFIGSAYAGNELCYIILEDPLKNDVDLFISRIKELPLELDVDSVDDLEWICDIHVW